MSTRNPLDIILYRVHNYREAPEWPEWLGKPACHGHYLLWNQRNTLPTWLPG